MNDNKKEAFRAQFRNPPAGMRGAPFWAWNCDLGREELMRQIPYFREMGFGGFHMHVRSGLSTPYMGEEYRNLISDCVDEAEKQGLIPRLYDEDRWPSGFAGGLVVKAHPEYRRRWLRVAKKPLADAHMDVGRYTVSRNPDDTLAAYRRLSPDEPATGEVWFAQIQTEADSERYNNSAYVDNLNPEAVRTFLQMTHEKLKERLGDRFGTVAPSIFTDEPQLGRECAVPNAEQAPEVRLVWTDDFSDTLFAASGVRIEDVLPELIWDLPGGAPSRVRWLYYDHIAERFASAYSDQIGAWCERNGINFTGHTCSESPLRMQAWTTGEAMRFYRNMTVPGMDMLCGRHEFTTAKQVQSVVRQYGKPGMMSELYGVLGWDLDFRGHKHHGDWQAALGVTLRVPHLSWMSMKGEAKRDYPQSIFYQSPWYRQYPLIEDHFARVNLAMSQGKPVCRIGVIHPMESMWLHAAFNDRARQAVERIERNFQDVTSWLLFGLLDFDYISESLLPALCPSGGAPLAVGNSRYDAIIVPACETLRASTLERLRAFREAGGLLIFLGDIPKSVDAKPDDRAERLAAESVRIPFTPDALTEALSPVRELSATNADGSATDDLIYRMQADGEERWLFLAHGREVGHRDIPNPQTVTLRIPGNWAVERYDTLTGEIAPMETTHTETATATKATVTLWEQDSLLLHLTKGETVAAPVPTEEKPGERLPIRISSVNTYTLSEPNPLLLDTAEWRLDDGDWQPEEELLRVDTACRKKLNWHSAAVQPWVMPDTVSGHRVSLRFRIGSEIEADGCLLALERPEQTEIRWNGTPVSHVPVGFYTDHDIKTVALPKLLRGENLLELKLPFERRETLEWCYLLGDFGVRICGSEKTVVPRAQKLGFGNIVSQTLPFYSGKITYCIPVTVPQDGILRFRIPQYRAALLEWSLDGGEAHPLAFSPYEGRAEVTAGEHTLYLSAYLNRTNTFGAVHHTDREETWIGPALWRTTGSRWCYEYELAEEGILHSPTLVLEKDRNGTGGQTK